MEIFFWGQDMVQKNGGWEDCKTFKDFCSNSLKKPNQNIPLYLVRSFSRMTVSLKYATLY